MSEDHASAAVPLQAQLVKGLPIYPLLYILRLTWRQLPLSQEGQGRRSTCCRQPIRRVSSVIIYFAAGEATNGNDHVCEFNLILIILVMTLNL